MPSISAVLSQADVLAQTLQISRTPALRLIAGDGLGDLFQRTESVRMLAHEVEDLGDPFLLDSRRHVDQHEGRGVHVIFADGHEARASAHGCAHERGSPVAAGERGRT